MYFYPTKDSGLILVGLWDDLDENKDYAPWNADNDWLIEFRSSIFNDSNYVSVSNGNTRFVLLQAGFYKITLPMLLQSIDASGTYSVRLLRNGSSVSVFEYVSILDNPSSNYYHD
ncbi:MAG: hypothetical protein ACW98I_18070 [Candidatus Hodarchaeales archaeon]|jgi:hypothetical protein